MRRLVTIAALFAIAAGGLAAVAAADDSHTYEIEVFNAFGLVDGSEVRVAGVTVGTVTDLDVSEKKRAVATVELSGPLARLGEDSECASRPQSLIAEYYIDCDPAGEPLPEGGRIPAEQVELTVQQDLVQNTLREPFAQRFQLILNEFGTALAGNPEDLNTAIRLGAPALRQLSRVTGILARQNRTIRDLNVDSDTVVSRLDERSEDVVRFIQEARDTAQISADNREDLSENVRLLDDFLAELGPTMRELTTVASDGVPLLRDLRVAGPGLDELAQRLPAFNRATRVALNGLGEAGTTGQRALRDGRDEIRALARAGRNAPRTAHVLSQFLDDIDDPRRIVEIDRRAARSCADDRAACWSTGRRHPTGYTGFEGLLNYVYYQAGALNQFDALSHQLHFSIEEAGPSFPCGGWDAGPEVPAQDGGTTTNIRDAARCVSWLGPNQPGINDGPNLPPYHPSVCPQGSLEPEICDPGASAQTQSRASQEGGAQAAGDEPRTVLPPSTLPGGEDGLTGILGEILGLSPGELPADLADRLREGNTGDEPGEGRRRPGGGAATDLLDYLFGGGR